MDIIKCKFCRRSFQGYSALCPECINQLDEKYKTVRNYLDKNKEANINRVAEETGVDEKSLLYLIREGRLSLRGEGSQIVCLKCGASIESGRYCEKCKGNLVHELANTISAMESMNKQATPAKPAYTSDSKSKIHILKDN